MVEFFTFSFTHENMSVAAVRPNHILVDWRRTIRLIPNLFDIECILNTEIGLQVNRVKIAYFTKLAIAFAGSVGSR